MSSNLASATGISDSPPHKRFNCVIQSGAAIVAPAPDLFEMAASSLRSAKTMLSKSASSNASSVTFSVAFDRTTRRARCENDARVSSRASSRRAPSIARRARAFVSSSVSRRARLPTSPSLAWRALERSVRLGETSRENLFARVFARASLARRARD